MKQLVRITLKGRIPSKKNSKLRTWKKLISSKDYQSRENEQLKSLENQVKPLGLNKPLYVNYAFYFPDNRKTDLSNKIESINDLLVKYGLIEDDNRKIIKGIHATEIGVDKENPRVEIELLDFFSD